MEQTRRNQVLEILDYWKTIEFLGQIDIPEESPENQKIISKLQKGETVRENKIELFSDLKTPFPDLEKKLESDAGQFKDFAATGDNITFCIGRTERNNIVSYLEKFMENPLESPEISYPKKSAIAWFSFQTDTEGLYLADSFQLSPILWAISIWEKSRAQTSHSFSLNTREYDKIVETIEAELQDRNVDSFLAPLYEKIRAEYAAGPFPEKNPASIGFLVYSRYVSEEKRDADEDPADYGDLGKSFFLNDMILLADLIASGKFGDHSDYEKAVVSYLLAGYEKTKAADTLPRTIISPGEPAAEMRKFFEKVLHVAKAPMGKWPAKFMPALMQQVAVNIAIDKSGCTPVFSVNGPPGTGKTTLLKEIVASNIVDRALLLAQNGTDPDTLFEKRSFTQGPLGAYGHAYFQYAPNYYAIKTDAVNDYGMLVASCNNAAVENITIDLPKGKDILESLEASPDDDESVKKGLEEVRTLFDVQCSEEIETITTYGKSREEKDIFFTRYANKLLGSEDCWGLVSAPFGKRSNIKKYCNAVLKPFLEEYKSSEARNLHRQKFVKQRELFLKQYQRVEALKRELEHLCTASASIPEKFQALSQQELAAAKASLENARKNQAARLKAEQAEIMHLEETRPRGLFGRHKNTETRDALIAEHKENAASAKNSMGEIDNMLAVTENAAGYRALLEKYSAGDKKMAPIDAAFLEKYTSADEKQATKAQITNPWFTAQYNREREKLFLYACRLHKEFAASSKCMRHNMINLLIAWNMFDECGERMQDADRKAAMPFLLQSIFLMTPVISTTFASAQSFLGDIEQSGVLGTLIVDEAGQAQPQMAVGAMFRCRKSIIVGDPKQIEPVVTAETDMIRQLLTSRLLDGYKDKKISVQGFADYINPYGTFLGEAEEQEWVGCPLVVHRRCIDPMYTISNILSYDGTMKQQTGAPKADRAATFILDKSCWIDVSGSENSGKKDHFVKAQGEAVLKLLAAKFQKDRTEIPRLFIITPFTSVKSGMMDMIRKSVLYKEEPRIKKWLEDNNVGTVHTFQGQGTDEVIFLLGCDQNAAGAANWVNKNIVNVAATRAKFRFYLIGDKNVWMCKPVKTARECTAELITAKDLDSLLPHSPLSDTPVPAKGMNPDTNTAAALPLEGTGAAVETSAPPAPENHAPAKPAAQQAVCPNCGKPLTERNGKYGKFLGCTGFPRCRYTGRLPK